MYLEKQNQNLQQKILPHLANSFEKISKQALKKNLNPEQFKDYIQVNLLKAFNVDSLSSVSNAELSNLAKTAASIATIWFLMTDNYNMVMLKSNGNDKDGANTKFKRKICAGRFKIILPNIVNRPVQLNIQKSI